MLINVFNENRNYEVVDTPVLLCGDYLELFL